MLYTYDKYFAEERSILHGIYFKSTKRKLISIRRHLHEYPELSYEEFETTKAIKIG